MNEADDSVVFVVDDDAPVRHALSMLLASVGYRVETYPDADSFLNAYRSNSPACLVLDVRMPGLSGLELQDRMIARGVLLPIIFVSGHADVAMAVRAMRRGAFDFLEKPFNDQALLDRINEALRHARQLREQGESKREIRARCNALTQREREVMERVVRGDMNKVIAADLGVSERTVEIHRGHVMEKMKARSLAELVRMAMQLDYGKTEIE